MAAEEEDEVVVVVGGLGLDVEGREDMMVWGVRKVKDT